MNSQPTADPLVGRTLGEFRLERRIGEGGFGAVYRARQVALDRPAVVKVLLSAFRHRVDQAQRFLSEARLASRLDHPYAAHIYAFGAEPDGVLWIAMELVRGIPLNTLLKLQGALPLTRFAPLFERICEVVHAAHEQGIIHRDIKPPNVMVMSRGGRLLPKLLDFGIAKFLGADLDDGAERRVFEAATPPAREPSPQDDDHPPESVDLDEQPPQRATRAIGRGVGAPLTTGSVATPAGMTNRRSRDLTATGEAMGSPAYMAPEQWVGGGVVDARTDIYALGVLAYQCLTRRLPFVEETTRAIAEAHTSKPMPALEGAFPVEVDALLRKALAKAKDDRFATALELGEAMRLAAGSARRPARAPPSSTIRFDSSPCWRRRNRWPKRWARWPPRTTRTKPATPCGWWCTWRRASWGSSPSPPARAWVPAKRSMPRGWPSSSGSCAGARSTTGSGCHWRASCVGRLRVAPTPTRCPSWWARSSTTRVRRCRSSSDCSSCATMSPAAPKSRRTSACRRGCRK